MEAIRGKLLVSTKAHAAGRKTAQFISCGIMYLLGLFLLMNFSIFREISWDLFHDATLGTILGIVLIVLVLGYPTFTLIVSYFGYKSYCDVYENMVVGTTGMSASNPHSPMQNFELSYQEITNVTESGKTIFIYTNHATFEVLALKNRMEAVREIRSRMAVKR